MNKKGILGNIIGAFIILVIGFTIFPIIQQEIDNSINCNMTNINITEKPIGETNSFGGGGSGQFGGYDGKVHKSWTSDLALYKTNKSILNKECNKITGASKTMLDIFPFIFIISIAIIALGMIFSSFRSIGEI